jgi:hypothetical protein
MRIVVQKEVMLVKPLQDDPQQFKDWYVKLLNWASAFRALLNQLLLLLIMHIRFNAFTKPIQLAKFQAPANGAPASFGVTSAYLGGVDLGPSPGSSERCRGAADTAECCFTYPGHQV